MILIIMKKIIKMEFDKIIFTQVQIKNYKKIAQKFKNSILF